MRTNVLLNCSLPICRIRSANTSAAIDLKAVCSICGLSIVLRQ